MRLPKMPKRRIHFRVVETLEDGVSIRRRAACNTNFTLSKDQMTDEHNDVTCKGCKNTYDWRRI